MKREITILTWSKQHGSEKHDYKPRILSPNTKTEHYETESMISQMEYVVYYQEIV